jgi:chromosome segregation ATPase
MKKMNQYSDEELMQMEYNALKKERDDLLECVVSWRKNFEELKVKYEELQNLFVETDDELNEYRDKFVNEAIQHEYLKNDYEYMRDEMLEMKADIATLKAMYKKF